MVRVGGGTSGSRFVVATADVIRMAYFLYNYTNDAENRSTPSRTHDQTELNVLRRGHVDRYTNVRYIISAYGMESVALWYYGAR